jgi:hypothetical protein
VLEEINNVISPLGDSSKRLKEMARAIEMTMQNSAKNPTPLA